MRRDSSKIIEIKNATVYRDDACIFADLSLDIDVGCQTAILGPNGAGKSTLLKLLSRELYPVWREGSYVRLFGHERWNVWKLRTRLGIVSHDLQHQYAAEVTHHIHEIPPEVARVVLLKRGKVIADGRKQDIRSTISPCCSKHPSNWCRSMVSIRRCPGHENPSSSTVAHNRAACHDGMRPA